MAVNENYIRERLLAYILPRRPETAEQETALENAAAAQAAYEAAGGVDGLPGNVSSVRNDGVQMTFREGASVGSGYTRETMSPAAWAILRNAGLIAYALPTAKRP
jgi:hypothetical protein